MRGARLVLATSTFGFVTYQLAYEHAFPVVGLLVVVSAGLLAGSRWVVLTLPAAYFLGIEAWYQFAASDGTPRWSRDDTTQFLVAMQIIIALTIAALAWVGVRLGDTLAGQARRFALRRR